MSELDEKLDRVIKSVDLRLGEIERQLKEQRRADERISMHPSVSVTKSCESNSSYGISKIFLQLCRCFCQGLKMSMTFGCNPQIHFCHFFSSSDFIIFGLIAFRCWVSCECKSSYSFNRIFFKHRRYSCQGLKMLMTFGCNPQINFGHFFRSLNVVIFELITFGHRVSCECNSSYSFNRIFLTLCRCFCLGLKICMTIAVIPGLISVAFFAV